MTNPPIFFWGLKMAKKGVSRALYWPHSNKNSQIWAKKKHISVRVLRTIQMSCALELKPPTINNNDRWKKLGCLNTKNLWLANILLFSDEYSVLKLLKLSWLMYLDVGSSKGRLSNIELQIAQVNILENIIWGKYEWEKILTQNSANFDTIYPPKEPISGIFT